MAALSLVMVSAAGEAGAAPLAVGVLGCSVCGSMNLNLPDLRGLATAGIVLDSAVLLAGGITGTASAVLAMDRIVNRGWFVSSYVLGGLNLAGAAIGIGIAADSREPTLPATLAFASGTIATLDIIGPSIGFGQRRAAPRWRPVPVGGRDAGGQLWAGVGVQLYDF